MDNPSDVFICPSCNSQVPELLKLDAGFRLRLRETNVVDSVPEEACQLCFQQFSGMISHGAQLMVQESLKQQQLTTMWRNRMNLIKDARLKLEHKHLAEAAVAYERYIRLVESVYGVEKGQLVPELFKNMARRKELTLITSIYWDLARIYDTKEQYRERLVTTIEKLKLFAPHSGKVESLLANARAFVPQAKNQDLFLDLEKHFGIMRKSCFIATAAFQSENAPEVIRLRSFRDKYLKSHLWGRILIRLYYRISPPIANKISQFPILMSLTRNLIRQLLRWIG